MACGLINGAGGGRVGHLRRRRSRSAGRRGHRGLSATRATSNWCARLGGPRTSVDYTTEDFTGGSTYSTTYPRQREQPPAHPCVGGVLTREGDPRAQRSGSAGHVFGLSLHLAGSGGQRVRLRTARPLSARQNREELLAVTRLMRTGSSMPVVDQTYPLADYCPGSCALVEQGHARGKIVVLWREIAAGAHERRR